jgi:uncharacterized protein (TIGR02996 family)
MNYRDAFEKALIEDRYSVSTRLAFADWLTDQGDDDAAAEQIRRASPIWIEADKWMAEFANTITEWDDIADNLQVVLVSDVIEAGQKYLDEGDYQCISGLGFAAAGAMTDDETQAAFWKHWQAWTGKLVEEGERGQVFSCSC